MSDVTFDGDDIVTDDTSDGDDAYNDIRYIYATSAVMMHVIKKEALTM